MIQADETPVLVNRDGRKAGAKSYMWAYRSGHMYKDRHDDTVIDLVARSKKTAEDKEYELQEIAEDLYVYSTAAFVGENASGKTTAIELLDCCYSILGEFRLNNKH